MTEPASRAQLLRWTAWFAMANAVVLGLIGLRYFSGFSGGGTVLSWIYLLLIYPSHHVMAAAGPLFVVLTPILLLRPSRKLITAAGVVLMALLIAVIMLDSLLWSESRFHINALTLQILGWQSWVFVTVIFLIALWFESMLASRVWFWVEARANRGGKRLAWLSVAAVLSAQFIYAWADASYYVPVTSVGQQLPVYKGFTAKRRLVQLGLVDPDASRERGVARRLSRQLDDRSGKILNYPAGPLQCDNEEPMNFLLIMADAMRSDMLSEVESPRLLRWAGERGQVFRHHFSGGNSSRMGVFSLFYGLPPGYWSTFESMQRSSVLVDEFQAQGYQLGLFSSASMYRPVTLDRTAFANVQGLRLETGPAEAPSWRKDEIMTRDWWAWLDGLGSRGDSKAPFFGFLFYNATNAMVYPDDMKAPPGFEAASDDELAGRFSNYRKSVYFVDQLIDQVLADLRQRGLLDSTVVVITSDHGEEFDESGAGLKNHGSGYSRYQLQVPMVVLWPGREPGEFQHRTSHYDLVPTLMQDLLGCGNPAREYASGNNLFSGSEWDWLLAGSYYNYAVLEPDQITITFPNGRYEVRGWDYRIKSNPEIRADVLQAVTKENSRFYQK
jgi:membrane-anchored protein YejM (alkaline phosphatase superfamily)